jgi:hypothetical protein
MRLLVFLQHLDELLNSVRASIGFLGGLNSEEDGSFLCLEYKTIFNQHPFHASISHQIRRMFSPVVVQIILILGRRVLC